MVTPLSVFLVLFIAGIGAIFVALWNPLYVSQAHFASSILFSLAAGLSVPFTQRLKDAAPWARIFLSVLIITVSFAVLFYGRKPPLV
ncbi:MAG: hypothetical protein PHQ81_11230 [Methanofollis sp.]|nr:hypothetical protein [Methanofollis sp.]